MASKRIDINAFEKGLVTDTIGVDGALLQLDDGWINRKGEIRKRGGKTNMSTGQVSAPTSTGMWIVCLPNPYYSTDGTFLVRQYQGDSYVSVGKYVSSTSITLSSWITSSNSGLSIGYISCAAFGDDEIYVSNSGGNGFYGWSGASKAKYSTGTVSMTTGSAVVTGVGSSWSANVTKGMYLTVNDSDLNSLGTAFRIASVDSNTQITLESAVTFSGSVSGAGYSISSFRLLNDGALSSVYTDGGVYGIAVHQGRLFAISKNGLLAWSAVHQEASTTNTYKAGPNYWNSSANTPISRGVGGRATAIVSYRGSLLIFKETAVFVLRGSVATDGTDLGASVDVLTEGCGHSLNDTAISTPVVTDGGVVFADQSGVWITDGQSVRSLSDGVIGSEWRDVGFTAQSNIVTTHDLGDRVAFQVYAAGGAASSAPTNTFVFDLTAGLWSTQSTATNYLAVCRPYRGVSVGIAQATGYLDDWAADRSLVTKQDTGGSGPLLKVTTHPIPLSRSLVGQGRVDTVFVNGYVTDAASDNPTLGVKLLYGRKGTGTGAESAVTVGSVSEGTLDQTVRLPVDGSNRDYSAVRLQVHQSGVASDARIYGASVDVAPAENIRP